MLNYLGPSFCTTYWEQQLKTYFEKVYFLWFLIFPQTEEEIRVDEVFLDDPDYKKHIMVLWHKVGFFERLLVAITDCLFPAGAWEDVLGICPLSKNVSRRWPHHGWSNKRGCVDKGDEAWYPGYFEGDANPNVVRQHLQEDSGAGRGCLTHLYNHVSMLCFVNHHVFKICMCSVVPAPAQVCV